MAGGFRDLLNLTLHWWSSSPSRKLYKVVAAQSLVDGAAETQSLVDGATKTQSLVDGAVATQTNC